MPGLVPGIHVLVHKKDVDGRDKPGHDERAALSVRLSAWAREYAGHLQGLVSLTSNLPIAPEITKSL